MDPSGKTASRLHARIADLLIAEIADDRHEIGSRFIESRLVSRFEVSRAPVRQALARLEEEGLVRYEARQGYVVLPGARDRARATGVEAPAKTREMGGLGSRHSWEGIYADVESAIASHIPFGDWQVPETALALHFSVSRTVARDVLARLQGSGLVHMDGGRWIAPALTAHRIDELYRLRAILEPEALKDAAGSLPDGFVQCLLARLQVAPTQRSDEGGLDALEHDLHVDLLGYCSNSALLSALRQPHSLLIAHRFLYSKTHDLYSAEPFLSEHVAILEALAKGDVETSATRLHTHLMGSRKRAISRIETLPELSSRNTIPYLRMSANL